MSRATARDTWSKVDFILHLWSRRTKLAGLLTGPLLCFANLITVWGLGSIRNCPKAAEVQAAG